MVLSQRGEDHATALLPLLLYPHFAASAPMMMSQGVATR